MKIETADSRSYRRMCAAELRDRFVIASLFRSGEITLYRTNLDRAVVGGVVPLGRAIELQGGRVSNSDYFCERREVGILNLGHPGSVVVDGTVYTLAPRECLYIRRGSRGILFSSLDPMTPACFFLVSHPAHADYPTVKASLKEAVRTELGTTAESNRRTVYHYIHPGGIRSCQLMMGFTEMHAGSVWSGVPLHTHDHHTEISCYFNLPPKGLILHLLGTPDETRHLVLREKEVALSPEWSLHGGAGTGGYAVAWALGGEHQTSGGQEPCAPESLD